MADPIYRQYLKDNHEEVSSWPRWMVAGAYGEPVDPKKPPPFVRNLSIRKLLIQLSPEERLEIFSDFCMFCGTDNVPCHCMNDE